MKQNLIHTSGVLNNGEIQKRINIVDSEKILLNNTDSLSSQLTNTGCEYVVLYNFDLNSGSITIPQGSILNFQGGSISNGTVTLQNTKLEGDTKWSGVTISGSCSNDVLTPQMFGAYPELNETESNKTRDTLGFQNLVRVLENQSTTSKTVYISSGHYAINDKIAFVSSCKVYGDGNTTIIDFYDGSGQIQFGKTASEQSSVFTKLNITITSDAHKLDRKIIVDDASGLNVGEYLIINDSKNGSFNSVNNYYKTCECVKIKKITENTVYIDNVLYGNYFVDKGADYTTTFSPVPSNRTLIYKFAPRTYNISDFKILSHSHNNQSPSKYYTLVIGGFVDSKLSGVTVENYGNRVAGYITHGLNYEIDGCVFKNYAIYSGSVGLSIASSQDYIIRSSTFRATSTALSDEVSNDETSIQSRCFVYDNLKFETSEKVGINIESDPGFDIEMSGLSQYYKLINISTPQTSFNILGSNPTIEGCKFYRLGVSNNKGSFTLRNCEIFANDFDVLFSPGEGNSVFIENNTFHGGLRILLQDDYFAKAPYDYLTIKNNIFNNNFFFGRGQIKNVIIENNFSNYGYLGSNAGELKVESLSIKNNVLNDGYMYLGLTGIITDGVISNNTILERTERTRDVYFLLGINSFKGSIQGNMIVSYVDNYYSANGSARNHMELIGVGQKSDIKIYDNVLKKGIGNARHAMIENMNGSIVTCDRNTHNSIRANYVNDIHSNCSSFSTYYGRIQNVDNIRCDLNTLGRMVFDNYSNTPYYTSNKKKSNTIISIPTNSSAYGTGKKVSRPNPLTFGKSYILNINNSGSDRYALYFSKYDMDDSNFNEDELVCAISEAYVGSNYVFSAEDPNVYPYLYVETTSEGAHTFTIYENSNLCHYDGAAYGTLRQGSTSNRPSYYNIYVGFKYWDTDLGKEITASEFIGNYIIWREYDGVIAGTKRIGTTSERPTGLYNPSTNPNNARANIYVGFKYFDTDLGKEIYASAISGDTVTWTEMTDTGATTIIAPVNATDATLPITSLTCEIGKYYRIDVAVETLTITLPAMNDLTTVRTVVIYLTGGTTPAITISGTAPVGGTAPDVYYQDGYAIESGKTYEVNCLWNGASWIVASVEIVATNNGGE